MPQPDSILKSGEKFAKEAGTEIGLQVSKPQGQTGEATLSVESTGSNKWFDWGVGAWVKRMFKKDGTSAGVDAKIKF